MYVNDSINVFLNEFKRNTAYVERNVFDRLIINV
jgi:hypothetical protein